MKNPILLFVCFLLNLLAFGQSSSEIIIPTFQDKYSESVKKLEAGETDINYQNFRYSFIESQQFIVANGKSKEMDSLKKEMFIQMKNSNSSEIISITKQILSIDYTDMMAHKILRQTYKIIGDTVNAAKYKTIQFGLLNSIVKNGDGNTCATAWPVIQVTEEYFILQMVGAELQKQTTDSDGGLCDMMQVKIDGKKKTYYFEITKVFQGYKKLGL
jgi:hypothetical protein